MRAGLEVIARRASGGKLAWSELPWHLIRYQHAAAILNWLREEYPAPATANAYRAALRGVLRECWRMGYLPGEEWAKIQDIGPAHGSRLPRGRDVETDELARLYRLLAEEGTVAAVRDAAWMAVVYSSGGVRLEESLRLTMETFIAEEHAFRVVGKGNKERKVWLSDSAMEALQAWIRVRGMLPGYVFLPIARDRKTLLHGRRMGQSTVREMCQRRARQAGLPHLTPHDFRRTSIGDVLDLTGDLSLAQELAGHATPQTTARYDRRGERKRRAVARRLEIPYRQHLIGGNDDDGSNPATLLPKR